MTDATRAALDSAAMKWVKGESDRRSDLVARGICPDCEGDGEIAPAQVGIETCALCRGTGKASAVERRETP